MYFGLLGLERHYTALNFLSSSTIAGMMGCFVLWSLTITQLLCIYIVPHGKEHPKSSGPSSLLTVVPSQALLVPYVTPPYALEVTPITCQQLPHVL